MKPMIELPHVTDGYQILPTVEMIKNVCNAKKKLCVRVCAGD